VTGKRAGRRAGRRAGLWATPAAVAVAAVAVIALTDAPILIWVVIILSVAAVAYLLGRLHGRPPARKPVSEFKRRQRAAAGQPPRKPAQAKADSAARRNGWLPPANPAAVTLALSDACAEGECHLCDGCEHKCGHDPAVIVARNTAAYDAAHQPDEPPY
jgi:hypothetical protein